MVNVCGWNQNLFQSKQSSNLIQRRLVDFYISSFVYITTYKQENKAFDDVHPFASSMDTGRFN